MSTETQKPQNPETPAGTDAETSKTESSEIHFRDLFLPPEILKAVEELGYELPTPIQAGAIPPLLKGKDLIGQAQTGIGRNEEKGRRS